MEKILTLKKTEIIEYARFDEFLELCFEISDYFSFTIRNFHNQEEDDYKNFLHEIGPFFVKKIKTLHWCGYYVSRNQPLEVCIFKINKKAKSIIKRYFDNLFLENRNQDGILDVNIIKDMPEDLCFYYEKKLLIGTVSHENVCYLFSPDVQIANRFQKICLWEEMNYAYYKNEQSLIDDNDFLRMDSLYMLLQRIREKPMRFLEKKSLVYLYHFVLGYSQGASESDLYYYNCLDAWNITSFVISHYGNEVAKGDNWQTIISKNSNSEEEAFDKFYELFDEFLQVKEDKPEIS